MTSLATVIGLLPMALKLGEGSESYAPLAQALIGGLTISVILTVFLVPAGYIEVDKLQDSMESSKMPWQQNQARPTSLINPPLEEAP